jgi:hypothetical protein
MPDASGRMTHSEVADAKLDVEWIPGIGWCGPDWEKAEGPSLVNSASYRDPGRESNEAPPRRRTRQYP